MRPSEIAPQVLRIQEEQVQPGAQRVPEVDDPGATTLAAPGQSPSKLAEPARAWNNHPTVRVVKQLKLEYPILVVLKLRGDLPGEDGGFDQFHDQTYVTG